MRDIIEHEGHHFRVVIDHDSDHGAPWQEEDGHGDVTEWTTRDKRPGELVLDAHRGRKRFYDFQGACKRALDEGWGALPAPLQTIQRNGVWQATAGQFHATSPDINAAIRAVCDAHRATMTPRQYAAHAAMADYERLRRWCNNEWHYVGVVVTLLDREGTPTHHSESVWGIESDAGEYLEETALECAGIALESARQAWREALAHARRKRAVVRSIAAARIA